MKVTIYSKTDCPWCDKAKALLTEKNISFDELKYNIDYSREQLAEKLPFDYNKITVPQIFFDNEHIGGYDDLIDYLKLPGVLSKVSNQRN